MPILLISSRHIATRLRIFHHKYSKKIKFMQPNPPTTSLGRTGRLLLLALSASSSTFPPILAFADPLPSPILTQSIPNMVSKDPVVAIYGAPPIHDPWEIQARIRLSGPLMGFRPDILGHMFGGAGEIDIGPITAEGGFSLWAGAHAAAGQPFFNLGGAWTFDNSYATGQGAWQGRVGGALGYSTHSKEHGEYEFENWHALSASLAIDGTWWFTKVAGLELRFTAGALIPVVFKDYDVNGVSDTQEIERGSFNPFVLATLGLAFGRWSVF